MRISDWSSDVCSSDLGIDRDELRVGRHPLEDRTAEGADAGAVFDEQFGVRPIYGTEHLADQPIGGRDDRADHHRMFEEALEEHAPGGGDPGCAAFTPARGSSGRTCHRYPNADVRSEEHTSELQSLMRISYA